MGTGIKQQILEAEWAGYRWGMNHPTATPEEREQAADAKYSNINSGVLSYAFERGAVMALEGKQPEDLEDVE